MKKREKQKICIIGAGITGLTAAYHLSKNQDYHIHVYEKDEYLGGLASSYKVGNTQLDKFYHHWFSNDQFALDLVQELKLSNYLVKKNSNTGMYYANNHYRLSTPLDLLKFKAISFFDRIRLGLFTLYVRRINNWMKLEDHTSYEWLKRMCGKKIFQTVWKPLLDGKFGSFADKVSAVWMWNKLKLRGSSRDKTGSEHLYYLKGGFQRIAHALAQKIKDQNGTVTLNSHVSKIIPHEEKWCVCIDQKKIIVDKVLFTGHLPQYKNIISNFSSNSYIEELSKIDYIGNICLVLQLKKSLSSTYWLNVNDASFPFVGIIEHTNFEDKDEYGSHIVYLSKYIETSDQLFKMNKVDFLKFSMKFIKKVFPEFSSEWIVKYDIWKSKYSQPIVVKNYSKLIPSMNTPYKNLFLSTMAQIYPEDRGTNYAIREGVKIANLIKENDS